MWRDPFVRRGELFKSLMYQDMLFFDAHKSGELLNRLNGDVQEFKHSVKACLSQVSTRHHAWHPAIHA